MRITDLLSRYEVPHREGGTHHHVSHDWTGVDCPFCSPGSGRFRAAFSASGRAANCWTCGRLGAVRLLAALTGESHDVVRRLLGGVREVAGPQILRRRAVLLPPGVGPLLPPHRRYLRGRGFDPDTLVKLWGLGGIGIAARLAWRLFIPVHLSGRVVTWTTRSVAVPVGGGGGEGTGGGARYVNARPDEEILPAKSVLYGADYVRHCAVVVEGPADAWRVGPGAVAAFGVVVTPDQLARLARFPVRVVCFDSDPAGRARAARLVSDLAPFPGKTYDVTLDAKDPGSAPPKEIKRLRKLFLD